MPESGPLGDARFHHVGVVVDDLEQACEMLGATLGLELDATVERSDLRSAFFRCGPASIEVIEVTAPEARRARLGDAQKARIEHIAIEVDGLDAVRTALEALGISTTAPGHTAAYRTFWTAPATTDDVLYQFLETYGD